MKSVNINTQTQDDALLKFHSDRYKCFLGSINENSYQNKCNDNFHFLEDEIDEIKQLENDVKNKILVDFISSEEINQDESISPIIIISFQYLFEEYQVELAMDAINKCLQLDIPFAFNQEMSETLCKYINENENSEMIQKAIGIINMLINKLLESSDSEIISDLINSGFPKILMKCDMKLSEVSHAFWYLLKIQFDKQSTFCDQIFDEEELEEILNNIIDILNNFSTNQKKDEHKDLEKQLEIVQKYLLKCISIYPHDFDFDCLLTDIINKVIVDNSTFKIKEIALKSSIRRDIQSMLICINCFKLIQHLISEIDSQGKDDQSSDKLFITCLNYLNMSFDCWFNNNEDSSSYIKSAISIVEHVIDNKSFKFVNSVLPIAEKIINKEHLINMKLEEMLISHIDTSEIGKLCLITSFMATGNMSVDQFCQSLDMFIEIYPILDDLYNSEQCDRMTGWIIEAIWSSVSKYYDNDDLELDE